MEAPNNKKKRSTKKLKTKKVKSKNKGDSFRQAMEKCIVKNILLYLHASDEEPEVTDTAYQICTKQYTLQLHPHPSNLNADVELMYTASVWFKKMRLRHLAQKVLFITYYSKTL